MVNLNELDAPILVLLAATLALHVGHVGIHVASTLIWKRPDLPAYDAHVGYLGGLVWFILVVFDHGTLGAPPLLAAPAGFLLVALGLYVHGAGLRDLVRYRPLGGLVTSGIYSRLRHPIYYGWVAVSFGMPLLLGSYLGLLTAPLWSGLIVVCGLLEERDMRRRFPGGEYESYARSTWF